MPIVGLTIKSIHAKKFDDENVLGNVRVNNNTNLKEVKEADVPGLNKKGLSITYEFSAEYMSEKNNKRFAEITVEGYILFLDSDQEKILKDWKKDKTIPDEVNIQLLNAVLRKCMTKALTLSEDLQLPPPIPLPIAMKKDQAQQESRYIG